MAFNLANNYKDTNSGEFFHERTNKYAADTNGVRLKIEREAGQGLLEIVGDFVVAGAGATLTLTTASPTDAYSLRYLRISVFDKSGNKASNVGTGTVASVVVDTSGLDAGDEWEVICSLSDELDTFENGDPNTQIWFDVANPASNPTVSINTVLIGSQVLAITQADGTTVVADTGSYDIGDFAALGTTAPFTIGLKNTGNHVLKITSATPAPDVLSITLGDYDKVIYPDQVIYISGTVDASGAAGPYTGTVTVVSDDPSNASYVITIAYDLV